MSFNDSFQKWNSWWSRWLTQPRLNFFFALFLLTQGALFLFLETTSGMLDRRGQVRGRDFLQFYIGGRIVARGDVDRLYDQALFREIQLSLSEINEKCPPYFSTYPPQAALLFSPLGRLTYDQAICSWWLIQIACFMSAGAVLFHSLKPPPEWRRTAALGFAAFYPVLNTFWNGQLAGLFLLFFVVGLELHQRRRLFVAGMVLSLLAMKPQLALGVGVWLLLRRDLHSIAGFFCGGLIQAAAVSFAMKPDVLLDYARATRAYPDLFRMHVISPDHQHAIAGILTDLCGAEFATYAMMIHFLVALAVGLLLLRLINVRRHNRHQTTLDSVAEVRIELSTAVLFTLLVTPHLLTYDLCYLLVPIAYGLSARRETESPVGLASNSALYLSSTLTQFYLLLGLSVVPIVMVVALYVLATRTIVRGATNHRSTNPHHT